LSVADRSTAGMWPRAAALLGRQALEGALDRLWMLRAPGVESSSMKAQLLALPFYLGEEELAEDAAQAWWAFTRATHEDAYELPPTHEELERWLDDVEQLIAAVVEA
jgi:hypothetical protein